MTNPCTSPITHPIADAGAPRYRVTALAGSLRRDSYNRRLLEAVRQLAPGNMSIEIFDGLDLVPLFDEDLEREHPAGTDGVQRLRTAVANADGLLIATPEYNQSLPGVLKNAIDWLSRPAPDEVLVGKPVAIAGVSSGRWGTRLAQAALRQVLTATEAVVMPAPGLFIGAAAQQFDANGALIDHASIAAAGAWIGAFADFLDRFATPPARQLAAVAEQTA